MKLKTIVKIVLALLAVDVLGFFWWIFSGQIPPDGFFIGTITTHFVSLMAAGAGVAWTVYPYALFAWIFLSPVLCALLAYEIGKEAMYGELVDVWESLAGSTRVFKLHSEIDDRLFKDLTTRVQRLENSKSELIVVGGPGGSGGGIGGGAGGVGFAIGRSGGQKPKLKKLRVKSKRA